MRGLIYFLGRQLDRWLNLIGRGGFILLMRGIAHSDWLDQMLGLMIECYVGYLLGDDPGLSVEPLVGGRGHLLGDVAICWETWPFVGGRSHLWGDVAICGG